MDLTNINCPTCWKSYGLDLEEITIPYVINCSGCQRKFTVRK